MTIVREWRKSLQIQNFSLLPDDRAPAGGVAW
jgi:hypothetical protein